jgi:hypothetical protein
MKQESIIELGKLASQVHHTLGIIEVMVKTRGLAQGYLDDAAEMEDTIRKIEQIEGINYELSNN